MTDNELTRRVIDCAVEVHQRVGPGLWKDVYETCLAIELEAAGLQFECGRVLPFIYNGHQCNFSIQTDFIVADTLLLQVEAVEELEPTHHQKLRSCLWMGEFPLGLMLNFNVVDMEQSMVRMTPTSGEEPFAGFDVFDDPDLGSR